MTAFFRFPSTPHLAWLGDGEGPREDKVLSENERDFILAEEVLVEEKIDGANLGISFSEEGELQVQNRGAWIRRDTCHPQFRSLWSWLASREGDLADALWPHYILFGEWCQAVHSIHYTRLPDWFLAFDVFDRRDHSFWSPERRGELACAVRVEQVPQLGEGQFDLDALKQLLGTSRCGTGPMEGLVVRRVVDGNTTSRAKLVQPEFVQVIEEHWSRGPLRRNRVEYRSRA